MGVFNAAGVPLEWDVVEVPVPTSKDLLLPQELITSIARNKVALKGWCSATLMRVMIGS